MDARTKGIGIWKRARTNAFANELAVRSCSRLDNWLFAMRTLFIVIPIVLVPLSLAVATPSALFKVFSIVSVGSNAAALFLSFLMVKLNIAERSFDHREQLAIYSMIAQKARRLEEEDLDEATAGALLAHLQDLFEIAKGRGIEPDDAFYTGGKKMLKNLNDYPFGLTQDTV